MDEFRAHFASQAAAADDHVSAAAAWCLQHFATAPPDLELRPANVADSAALLQMEAIGFRMFDRPRTPNRLQPYQCANGTLQGFGYLVKVVACTPRGIGAYLIAQVRNWGEVYICEVVARPVRPEQRIRSAGAVLLGVVARMAQQLGLAHVTAQVRRLDRHAPIPGYGSARIIAHDARHGLRPSPERGILPDGDLSDENDAWLQGRPDDILRILLRKFDGPALEAASDAAPQEERHAVSLRARPPRHERNDPHG